VDRKAYVFDGTFGYAISSLIFVVYYYESANDEVLINWSKDYLF